MTGIPGPAGSPDEVPGAGESIEQWLSELQVDDASRDRGRRRWLQQAAREEATLAGILADLAERGRAVIIDVAGGRHHRGRLRLLGQDFCALRTEPGRDVLIAFRAINSVRPQPGEGAITGDRSPNTTATLAEAVSRLSDGDAVVQVMRRGTTEPLHGELRSVGRDVLVLRVDAGGEVYVPLDSLDEVSPTVSG